MFSPGSILYLGYKTHAYMWLTYLLLPALISKFCSRAQDPSWPAGYAQQRFLFDRVWFTRKQNASNKRRDRRNFRINKCLQVLVGFNGRIYSSVHTEYSPRDVAESSPAGFDCIGFDCILHWQTHSLLFLTTPRDKPKTNGITNLHCVCLTTGSSNRQRALTNTHVQGQTKFLE